MILSISQIRVARSVISVIAILSGFVFSLQAMAAGQALDVTINVVGPGQHIQGTIDQHISLPNPDLSTGHVHLQGIPTSSSVASPAGTGEGASDLSKQELGDAQETETIEHATHELMNEVQQADQSVQDSAMDTD